MDLWQMRADLPSCLRGFPFDLSSARDLGYRGSVKGRNPRYDGVRLT
jgi:hypothetical protein